MKVIVARHAETNYNEQKLVNYELDAPVVLTQKGLQQAEALALDLKDRPIELIFVSELNRTQETAMIINKYHNVPIISDPRLNDIRNGFEGESTSKYREARDSAPDPINARFNGGESIADVGERTREFLADLKKHLEETILIVTSNHNAKHIRIAADHLTIDKILTLYTPNAAFFEFDLEDLDGE